MLVRQNAGRPQGLIHVVTYPEDALPSREFLEERVMALQERLPMLYSRVINRHTNRPGYALNDAPWPANDILTEGFYSSGPGSELEQATSVLRDQLARFEARDFDKEPMWSVSRIVGGPMDDSAYLVVCVAYVMADTRAAERLTKALTAPNIDYIAPEPWNTATRFDDTFSLRPSARFIAPIFYREIVLPRLPKSVQAKLRKEDPWPGTNVDRSPLVCGSGILAASVPPTTVARLREQAKRHHVASLHAVYKMAFTSAIWGVFLSDEVEPKRIIAATARDDRRTELGHSAMLHNYVQSPEYDTKVSGGQSFWASARQLSDYLRAGTTAAEARMTLGLLTQIPDPDVDAASADFDPAAPTGWERFFIQRAASATPFRNSYAITNTGYTELPAGATDQLWGQSPSPFAPVFNLNLFEHEGGVRMTAVFCEGAAVTMEETRMLLATWELILHRIAESAGNTTIAELAR
ncbi:hypothetical protein VHUM_00472 [Vanrija humicola]|uniref:Condensation domain-containing protein n=1 Tax=Vanrija humicola TaxID=5417 RepID=A0A7D8V5T5_VANHU|nr:hypothetical protein VHUM_00472 [Vanrija humicola]